jgi:hypothetical protein
LDGLTLDNGHDGALLDGRGALEAVGVDTSQELSLEVHAIERVGGFIVVGLDLAWRVSIWRWDDHHLWRRLTFRHILKSLGVSHD